MVAVLTGEVGMVLGWGENGAGVDGWGWGDSGAGVSERDGLGSYKQLIVRRIRNRCKVQDEEQQAIFPTSPEDTMLSDVIQFFQFSASTNNTLIDFIYQYTINGLKLMCMHK